MLHAVIKNSSSSCWHLSYMSYTLSVSYLYYNILFFKFIQTVTTNFNASCSNTINIQCMHTELITGIARTIVQWLDSNIVSVAGIYLLNSSSHLQLLAYSVFSVLYLMGFIMRSAELSSSWYSCSGITDGEEGLSNGWRSVGKEGLASLPDNGPGQHCLFIKPHKHCSSNTLKSAIDSITENDNKRQAQTVIKAHMCWCLGGDSLCIIACW